MKLLKAAIVMALVLALATPALAEIKLNGYYRLQGTYYDVDNGSDKTQDFAQRLRMKLTNQLNENVGFVYFAEFDSDWGKGDKFGGNGAKRGADGNALETKNAYLTLKKDNLSAVIGLQGWTDIYNGLLFSDDAAGVTANGKFGAATLGLLYFKYDEGASAVENDESDMYGATVSFAATEALKLSAAVYVHQKETLAVAGKAAVTGTCLNSDSALPTGGCVDAVTALPVAFGFPYTSALATAGTPSTDVTNLYYGLRADLKATDALSLSAFGLFADLEDGNTYVADLAAKYNFAKGNLLFEGLFAPEEKDPADRFVDLAGGNFMYNGQNLMFLIKDIAATNNGYGEGKYLTPLGMGHGLTMLMLSGNYDFGPVYAGFGLGWADTEDEDLGMEYGVKVGKKILGNVDLSVRAAQWNPGDYYAADDKETKVIGMINVGF